MKGESLYYSHVLGHIKYIYPDFKKKLGMIVETSITINTIEGFIQVFKQILQDNSMEKC